MTAGQSRQADLSACSRSPLGVGSLAANLVSQAAVLVVALVRAAGDGSAAAQAARIAARAGALSASNDDAYAAATRQLAAASSGRADGFLLAVSLGDAAGRARLIAETACDLALLAAELTRTGDGARRADYAGIAQLSAAAAGSAARLVRTNLTVAADDWRLSAAAAQRVAADER